MFIKRCSRNLPWLHQNLIFEQEQKKSENLLFQYLTEPFKISRTLVTRRSEGLDLGVEPPRGKKFFQQIKGFEKFMPILNHPFPLKWSIPQTLIVMFLFSLQTDFEVYADNVNLVKSEFRTPDFKTVNCKSNNRFFFRCVN